jgi:hypothetical protein
MKTHEDPLDVVRESRIRLSHDCDNDPKRLVAALRTQESKYARQIERLQHAHARVAEGRAEYGQDSSPSVTLGLPGRTPATRSPAH